MELADTQDLGSCAARHPGSSPGVRTLYTTKTYGDSKNPPTRAYRHPCYAGVTTVFDDPKKGPVRRNSVAFGRRQVDWAPSDGVCVSDSVVGEEDSPRPTVPCSFSFGPPAGVLTLVLLPKR